MSQKIWIIDFQETTTEVAKSVVECCAKDLEITFPAAFTSSQEALSYREAVESDVTKLTGERIMLQIHSMELFYGGFAEALKKFSNCPTNCFNCFCLD